MTAPATTALSPGVSSTTPAATIVPVAGSERPDFQTPAYKRMATRYEKCRALMSGTQAIRDGGEDFLPRFEAEDDDAAYTSRSTRAALYNGFARTVLASVGLLLQIEPAFGTDMDPTLVELWEDVDAAGTHGRVFTRNLVVDAIVDGHGGILVDVPRAPTNPTPSASAPPGAPATGAAPEYSAPPSAPAEAITAASLKPETPASEAAYVPGARLSADDEAKLGVRPYFVQYKADDIFRPMYEVRGGKRVLVLLVLRETVDQRVGLLAYRTIVRYRIYTNVNGRIQMQVWQAPNGAAGVPTLYEGPIDITNVSGIPWCPLRAGPKISDVETKPPLEDLADLNIEHHVTKTNILNLEDLAMVPTPVRIGAPKDQDGNYPPMILGPRSTIEAPHIEGLTQQPVYWLTPDTAVLQPAQQTLDKTEAAMGAAGMAFLAPQTRAAETATAREIDSRAQNATLSMVGQALQDCLETAFGYAAEFMGIKASGSITISNEYEVALMEPRAMDAYAKLVELGFPKRLALEALQVGGRIDADVNLDDAEAEWEAGLAAAQQQKMDELAAQTAAAQARGQNGPPLKPGGGPSKPTMPVDMGTGA